MLLQTSKFAIENSPLAGVSPPMKRALLRTTYIKQLSDLGQLYDNEILNADEYEEQRGHIVALMCDLN